MARNLFVLKGVSDFSPGAFENTAVENGSIQLGSRGGEYLTRGSYTSPAMRLAPFQKLLASWNADTPHGTTVEVQVRVAAQGQWSRWMSFGTWSPFVYRASEPEQKDDFVRLESDILAVSQPGVSCDTAQVRILLHTENGTATPYVRLLAVTVLPTKPDEEEPAFTQRVLPVPEYSALVRDPSISGYIGSATTLTMLMNRWGEDALPEETARAMYDTAAGRFGNRAFISAAAGMYSYECYARFCGLDTLRREVQHGIAIAAEVHYRAPALGTQEEEEGGEIPVWEEATTDSSGHLVAVRGFTEQEGSPFVVINDPMAPADRQVKRLVPLELFQKMYTGLAYHLHKGPKGAGRAKPERNLTTIEFEDGEIKLSVRGELLQPGASIPVKSSRATIAFTLGDGVAYASAAQKKFYYIQPGEDGSIRFDPAPARGRKMVLYLIGSRGTTWVAEKNLPAAEPEEAPGGKGE